MKTITFRPVKKQDLNEVFPLLNQLTEIDYFSRDKDKCWDNFISNTSSNSIVGLLEDKVVAYGSIVIESKIRGELAGHIEDIVVDKGVRGKNVGVNLIKELIKIGKTQNCYRITLFCDESLSTFYAKNGFEVNKIAMKKYL